MSREKGVPPPGAVIAGQRKEKDERDDVQYGERVPYVIPERTGRKLAECALGPLDFLADRYSIEVHDGVYQSNFVCGADAIALTLNITLPTPKGHCHVFLIW